MVLYWDGFLVPAAPFWLRLFRRSSPLLVTCNLASL